MSAIAASLVGGLISAGANYASAERANEVSRENMLLSNRLSLQNLRDSPAMTAKGFQGAGFSPVSALGQFSNASAPSPAQGQKAEIPNLALYEALQADANIKLARAQEKNLETTNDSIKQDVIGKKIENANKQEQSKASGELVRNNLKQAIENRRKQGLNTGFLEDLQEVIGNSANSGTLEALIQNGNASKLTSESLKYSVENALDELTAQKKIDNKAFNDLAEAPRLQRRLLERQVTLALKQINYVSAQIEQSKATTKLTNQQRLNAKQEFFKLLEEQNKIKAEVDQLEKQNKLTEEQARMLRDTNFLGMIRDGDYGGAMVSGAWQLLLSVLKFVK
jgi:cell division protein FtsB